MTDNIVDFEPKYESKLASYFLEKMEECEYERMKGVYINLMPYIPDTLNPVEIEEILEGSFGKVFKDHHERMYQEVDEYLLKHEANPKNNVTTIMNFLDELSPKYADKDFCSMTVNEILCELSEEDAYNFQLVIGGKDLPNKEAQ